METNNGRPKALHDAIEKLCESDLMGNKASYSGPPNKEVSVTYNPNSELLEENKQLRIEVSSYLSRLNSALQDKQTALQQKADLVGQVTAYREVIDMLVKEIREFR